MKAETITLTRATLAAIHELMEADPSEWGGGENGSSEACVQQDGCDIHVDFDYEGHYKTWTETDDELPPPNTETFSEWVCDATDVTSVVAYNADGYEIEVVNAEEI